MPNRFLYALSRETGRGSVNQHYLKRLVSIISSRLDVPAVGLSESHHIFPRSWCKEWEREKDNIVILHYREHFLIHRLMCLAFPEDRSMAYAFFLMAGVIGHEKSKTYSKSKELLAARMRENNPLFNPILRAKKSKEMQEAYKAFTDRRNWKLNNPSDDRDLIQRNVQKRKLDPRGYHPNGFCLTDDGRATISARMKTNNPMRGPSAKEASRKSLKTRSTLQFWYDTFFRPKFDNHAEIIEAVKNGTFKSVADFRRHFNIKTDMADSIWRRYA